MRSRVKSPVTVALVLLAALASLPMLAHVQQSAGYRLKEPVFNAGGRLRERSSARRSSRWRLGRG